MRYEKHITRQMLQANPNTLFVFGDNMAGQGFGGQAKEMRGEPNAVGIPTKNYPSNMPKDFFSDDDFDKAKVRIEAAFDRLYWHAGGGGKIVWPLDDIGTGLADLPNRSPKIWAFIQEHKHSLEKLSRQ